MSSLAERVPPVLRILLGPLALLGLLIPVLRRLTRDSVAEPGPSTDPAPVRSPDRDAAVVAHTQAMREAMEKIRTSLAAYGGAIGVASGGLIAVTSWTTFSDLFPLPVFPGSAHPILRRSALWGLAVVLPVTAIVCTAVLTTLFFRAQRRILVDSAFFDSSADPMPEAVRAVFADALGADEQALVRYRLDVLRTTTKAEGREPSPVETSDALVTGAATVLERRSAALYTSRGTLVLAGLASIAVAGMFALGHWSAGQRERLTDWTGCLKDAAGSVQCAQLDPLPDATGAATPGPTTADRALNDCATRQPDAGGRDLHLAA